MTQLSPEAQALLDRLARMDTANPRQDKAVIEAAITAHLNAFGLPARSFIWPDGARVDPKLLGEKEEDVAFRSARIAARTQAEKLARHGVRPEFAEAYGKDSVVWRSSILALVLLALFYSSGGFGLLLFATDGTPAGIAAGIGFVALCFTILGLALLQRRNAMRKALWHEAERTASRATREVTLRSALEIAGRTVRGDYGTAAKSRLHPWDATTDAMDGIETINGLAILAHPEARRLIEIWRPLVEAYEAGLFLYWIFGDRVICVLQPSLSIADGRLHRADGPAVHWPSGENLHFWQGARVPAWIIEQPERITVETMREEPQRGVRDAMLALHDAASPPSADVAEARRAAHEGIGREAVSLVSRLQALDPARPRHDREAIEQAFLRYLKLLDLPPRPVICVESVEAGYEYVQRMRRFAAEWAAFVSFLKATAPGAAIGVVIGLVIAIVAAPVTVGFFTRRFGELVFLLSSPFVLGASVIGFFLARNAASWRSRNVVGDPLWADLMRNDQRSFEYPDKFASRTVSLVNAEANENRIEAWEEAEYSGLQAALAALPDAALRGEASPWEWTCEWEAYFRSGHAASDAIGHVARVNGLTALRTSVTERSAALQQPLLAAFEAGLGEYWVLPRAVVCVLRPSLPREAGQLRTDVPQTRRQT